MVTYEKTTKVESGLDIAIKGEHGGVIAWVYSEGMAKSICDSLNNFWRKSDGSARCSTCDPIKELFNKEQK